MKKEIIFTIQKEGFKKNICVSIDIKVNDLIEIIKYKYQINEEFKLYSENHQETLNGDKSLFEEKIWDGDILMMMR